MAKIDFGGVLEEVVTREEFPLAKAREVLKNETVAVIGYGVQGPAQRQWHQCHYRSGT
jgi:ketol-acid reductoisomerase